MPRKTVSLLWTQDQLKYVDANGETTSGFYLNLTSDGGNNEYVKTNEFQLPIGRYTILIRYESRGGGKIRAIYSDGRYISDITGFMMLSEGEQEMVFPLHITNLRRLAVIQAYQRESRNDDDYLLIREIEVRTAENVEILQTIKLFFLFMVINVLVFFREKMKNGIRQNSILISVFSVAVFFTSLPLFVDYLPGNTLDLSFHLTRIEGLRQGLITGEFPVRVQPGWLNNHGYAVSVFYGDALLYFPAILCILGLPLQTAYQIFVLAVNIATIWTSWYACKKITQDDQIAMFGAIIYTGNLYRIIAIYMRAAVGAYSAMIFFPLIMLGLWEIFALEVSDRRMNRGMLPLIIGFSGVLLTHIISFEMIVCFAALLCMLLWRKTFQKERFLLLCKSVGATVLLNLWFLVPFLDYLRDEFRINSPDAYVGDHYKMQERGLFLPQMFLTDYEVISVSMGHSVGIRGEMPITLGVALTMVLVFGLVIAAIKFQKQEKNRELILCLGLTVISLVLTLHSFPYILLGRTMPFLQMVFKSIQYNWRFLTISTVLLLWLFCIIGKEMMQKQKKVFLGLAMGISILGVLQAVDFSSEVLNEMSAYRVQNGFNLVMDQIGGGEYVPVETNVELLTDKLESTENIIVHGWKRDGIDLSCDLQNLSEEEQRIELPLLGYRYLEAEDNEFELDFKVLKSENGLVEIIIPGKYQGNIVVHYREPIGWRVAEIISVIVFFRICIWVLVENRKYGTCKVKEPESERG